MKRNYIILLLAVLTGGIILAAKIIPQKQSTAKDRPATHPPKTIVRDTQKISYAAAIDQSKQLKKELNGDRSKAAGLFTDILLNLSTFWVGTPWDFNGVTQEPGKGQIACGYFVTTLLRDAGVTLNRVKLAQCASGLIISSQVQPANRKNYSALPFDDFIAEIKKKGKGVFLIGLDYHTGFLINDGTELYFVHSNYIGREGVVKETAATSRALRASKWRSTGWLTNDRQFLEKWMHH